MIYIVFYTIFIYNILYLTRFSETHGYAAWNSGVNCGGGTTTTNKQANPENNERISGCSLAEHIIKATAWKDRGKPPEMSVQSVFQPKNQVGHLTNRVRRAKILREIFGKDLVVVL